MIKSFSKVKKIIIGIILSVMAVITVVHVADTGSNRVCGEWILSGEYIPSSLGYSSRLASADDLAGEKIKIYKNNNELVCEGDRHIYNLKKSEPAILDRIAFAKRYAVRGRIYLDDISFPVKRVVFENEELEMTAVNLLIDSDGKIFVRFNDPIGDLAIFPLEK